MRLSSLLVWGHSTQHFPDLSATFAMLSVTPVLGLEAYCQVGAMGFREM